MFRRIPLLPRAFFLLLLLTGCQGVTQAPYASYVPAGGPRAVPNPVTVPAYDPYILWETVVDVTRLYFWRIREEYPCHKSGDMIMEGLLITFPQVGATWLEPWRRDSADTAERNLATLQSIRRTAYIRVRAVSDGYLIDVRVTKELEDLAAPSKSRLPPALFRQDTDITEMPDPIAVQDVHAGWIPLGRDTALEQEILMQIQARLPGR